MWKIIKEMGVPDHHTCFLRSQYAGQEATVRILCGTTNSFKIGKAVNCHPAYLTYMQSTSCEMLGCMKLKIAGRNIKNLRYVDDSTLMAESEESICP